MGAEQREGLGGSGLAAHIERIARKRDPAWALQTEAVEVPLTLDGSELRGRALAQADDDLRRAEEAAQGMMG